MGQAKSRISTDMAHSVKAVEDILKYRFKNKKLLEEALTHSSCKDSTSYERLEFVGDAVLDLAFTNFIFLSYPSLDPGQLTSLRIANTSTEKLARVALRCGLHNFLRHNAEELNEQVRVFSLAVHGEEDAAMYFGGSVKAPKVLADVVESLAAAVYVDCDFNLKAIWMVFKGVLEPIATPETLQQLPHPGKTLYEHCQKQGKQVGFKHWVKGSKHRTSIYVDGVFLASHWSDQKEISKLNAAKEALQKLAQCEMNQVEVGLEDKQRASRIKERGGIERPEQKFTGICSKKKLQKPCYRIEQRKVPPHDRKDDKKQSVKDADKSTSVPMLSSLQESSYLWRNSFNQLNKLWHRRSLPWHWCLRPRHQHCSAQQKIWTIIAQWSWKWPWR